MAIIYSYPEGTPTLLDTVLGVQFDNNGNPTKSFLISDIIGLVPTPPTPPTPTLQEVCNAGSQALNVPILIEDLNTPNVLQVFSEDGVAIFGQSAEGAGVYGNTDIGYGVYGTAQTGYGVYGYSVDGRGVYAECGNGGEGGALIADGGSTGLGIGVMNGGISILGLQGPVTGYQLSLSLNLAAKPSTNTWTIVSDERVKTNVNPYTKGLETILAINPITYDYNGKAGFDSTITNNIGIIAQDVINIIPESINTYHAKLNEDDKEKTELYNFDSHALTFILINAIKELKAEIDLLKSK
jgi:hypothetical protein